MDLSEFNDTFSGTLEINLSKSPKQISKKMYNMMAPNDAKIKSVKFHADVWIEDSEDFVEPTKEQLAEVVIEEPEITVKSIGGSATIKSPNGKHFTVGDLIVAIEKVEKKTRGNTEWFGGIDVHHIFFEFIEPSENGNGYEIHWGS